MTLFVKYGILPLKMSSWYLANDHDGESLGFVTQKTSSDAYQVTVPLGYVSEDGGQMLLVALDSTPTSSVYFVNICGSFQVPSQDPQNPITEWPVKISIMQFNQEPYTEISTAAILNIT